MNEVKVLFFATLRDRIKTKEINLELMDGSKVKDLKAQLKLRFPELDPAVDSALISINREYAFEEDEIPDGAEVALFPPVSGGVDQNFPTIYKIIEAEININELVAQITLPSTGAACIFSGMVRAITERGDPHITQYLEYEAYQPMAEAKMRQVAEEIRTRWPSVEGIAIVQRIGHLDPGTPTVLIACTAAHRDTGVFEAARYGIDRLKEIVPIWKKEVTPDGEEWVEGAYHPTVED
jgi:molybdopterin converting factor subunit 1